MLEEGCAFWPEVPRHDVIAGGEELTTKLLFHFWENIRVWWCQVQRVRRMWKGFELILICCHNCCSNSVKLMSVMVQSMSKKSTSSTNLASQKIDAITLLTDLTIFTFHRVLRSFHCLDYSLDSGWWWRTQVSPIATNCYKISCRDRPDEAFVWIMRVI